MNSVFVNNMSAPAEPSHFSLTADEGLNPSGLYVLWINAHGRDAEDAEVGERLLVREIVLAREFDAALCSLSD